MEPQVLTDQLRQFVEQVLVTKTNGIVVVQDTPTRLGVLIPGGKHLVVSVHRASLSVTG